MRAATDNRGEGVNGATPPDRHTDREHDTGSSLFVFSSEAPAMSVVDVDRFYGDILNAIAELAQKGGTAVGAAAVVKRVARVHGIDAAERLPLPRLNRWEQQELGVAGASYRRDHR
jgi:hypothetical protein